jgi:hypothetical protein
VCLEVNSSVHPLHQLVLQEFMDQSQHAPIGSRSLHRKLRLKLLADLLQGPLLFQALPDLRTGNIEAIVVGANLIGPFI